MEAKVMLNENVNHERREKGVTTVEYAVMLVLVAIAVLGFGAGLSGSVTGVFSQIVTAL
jgi:Flp pilus assembly pilin Flp